MGRCGSTHNSSTESVRSSAYLRQLGPHPRTTTRSAAARTLRQALKSPVTAAPMGGRSVRAVDALSLWPCACLRVVDSLGRYVTRSSCHSTRRSEDLSSDSVPRGSSTDIEHPPQQADADQSRALPPREAPTRSHEDECQEHHCNQRHDRAGRLWTHRHGLENRRHA